MIKILPVLFFFVGSFVFFLSGGVRVFADTNVQAASPSASLDAKSSAGLVTSAITEFFKTLDSAFGGFVFSTPDFFSHSIKLTDGTAIKGMDIYSRMFFLLSIPLSGFIIFWFGLRVMGGGQVQFIKQFAKRLFIYVFLLMVFIPLLSLSIKTENLFTQAILSVTSIKEPSVTAFVSDYFTGVNKEVERGTSPETFGIPNPSLFDIGQSIVHVMVQLFFLMFILLTLSLGFIFIFMQFVVRFLTMFFLSLIAPLVIPFVLSEKTESIITSYLRIWFTLLIHQPFFALGFAIVSLIVRSILQNGPNLSVLLLYIASLFFLGTVNVLASRVFADFWISAGVNLEAKAITTAGSRFLSGPIKLIGEYKNVFSTKKESERIPHTQGDILKKRPVVLH